MLLQNSGYLLMVMSVVLALAGLVTHIPLVIPVVLLDGFLGELLTDGVTWDFPEAIAVLLVIVGANALTAYAIACHSRGASNSAGQ